MSSSNQDSSAELLAKYQKALGHAKMGLWQFDFKTQRIQWDEGIHRLYNGSREIFSAHLSEWIHLIHPDDQVTILEQFKNAEADLSDIDYMFRITLVDGTKKFIRSSGVRVRDESGRVVAAMGVNWDVTNEHRLQENLSKSNLYLEKILDTIPDPVFIKDGDHRTIFANKEFEKLAGKNKADLIGRMDEDFLTSVQAKLYYIQDEEALRNTNSSYEFDESIRDDEGHERHLMTKKTAFHINETEKVLVGVIRDITDVKRIQSSMIEQSKMASLGEMAAEIAHEINNPLMIIQAKSQILQERLKQNSIDATKLIADLQAIEKNSMRIDKIIKSLKSVSRKADQDPFEPVSIRRLIEETIEISRERFSKNNIELKFNFEDIIDYNYVILARSSEIVQVLVNLLNNSFDAIKDTPSPWVKINLFLQESTFTVQVVDSGKLIPPDVAQRMMDPFFTTKTAGAGTGLGLSVSKQIIENHNGKLFYEAANKENKFTFQLKRSESISKL